MNVPTLIVLVLVAAGVFFACRALFVKKAGRCGGYKDCEECALKHRCKQQKKQ